MQLLLYTTLAKVVSQGQVNMPRNHILWSSAHIKAILMKIIFNFEKSGPAKTGLAGLVATALTPNRLVVTRIVSSYSVYLYCIVYVILKNIYTIHALFLIMPKLFHIIPK